MDYTPPFPALFPFPPAASLPIALGLMVSGLVDKMIETTEMFSLISLLWKHREAHCFLIFWEGVSQKTVR